MNNKTTSFKVGHASDDIAIREGYKAHRILGFGNINRITGPETDLTVKRHWTDGSIEKIEGVENGVNVLYKWHYSWTGQLKEITVIKNNCKNDDVLI